MSGKNYYDQELVREKIISAFSSQIFRKRSQNSKLDGELSRELEEYYLIKPGSFP